MYLINHILSDYSTVLGTIGIGSTKGGCLIMHGPVIFMLCGSFKDKEAGI